MGLIADAYRRVLAFTTLRDAPSYVRPTSAPADNRGDTNSDTSVQFIRKFVSVGPARTQPPSDGAAGSRPNANGTLTGARTNSSGPYPKPGSDSTTNAQADGTDDRAPMKYGYQPAGDDRVLRPGGGATADRKLGAK